MTAASNGGAPEPPAESRLELPPLAAYVHIPWCVRKCPYCDFNSHAAGASLPEEAYVDALLADLDADLEQIQSRRLTSIFFGGGTPSLFSASALERVLEGMRQRVGFADDIEITLEANPGTFEQAKFRDYRSLGINRLSIGVQSFQPAKLKALGRIHDGDEAIRAADMARAAGFDNFNLDLMHGLPEQSLEDALSDLRIAIAQQPTHLSWYQLTVEPNTEFWNKPPRLPEDETLWDIQEAGQALLAEHGYRQYETSAYAQPGRQARHNLNYWTFGDFLGLGSPWQVDRSRRRDLPALENPPAQRLSRPGQTLPCGPQAARTGRITLRIPDERAAPHRRRAFIDVHSAHRPLVGPAGRRTTRR